MNPETTASKRVEITPELLDSLTAEATVERNCGGIWGMRGVDTSTWLLAVDPSVVLALVERIRELERALAQHIAAAKTSDEELQRLCEEAYSDERLSQR